MMEKLVLQTAYATWVMDENDNNWVIRDKDANIILKLGPNWDERKCMAAIRLGREFEKKAFGLGVDTGMEKTKNTMNTIVQNQLNYIQELEAMNTRLSTQLEKFIIGDDNDPN